MKIIVMSQKILKNKNVQLLLVHAWLSLSMLSKAEQNKTVKNENKNTGLYPNCLVAKDWTYKGFTQDNLWWGAENYMFSIKFKERDQWGFFLSTCIEQYMPYFSLLVPLGLQTTAVVNLKWFVLADQL